MHTPPLTCLATTLALLGAMATPAAMAEPSMVIVVRHAERASEPAGDPVLSPAGRERARQLAEHLATADIAAVVTTPWRRTQETAAPVAQQQGLQPHVVPTRGAQAAAHVDEVVATVRQLSGVVLVVGHSNTVAGIVAGLSTARPIALCETSYGHLFVVSPAAGAVVQMRYGAADPPPAPGCQ
jgi:broad specificity phosphatase PhoE